MKRLMILLVGILVLLIGAVPGGAVTLEVGDFGMKFRDVTVSDLDYKALPGGLPNLPHGIQSDNIWGISSMTSIHGLMGGDIEAPVLGAGYWSEGDNGQYLQAVYGGLHLNRTVDSAGSPATGFPFDMYFQDAGLTGGAYLQVYLLDHDAYANDYVAGPNKADKGELGTFGSDIMSGTLWLDCVVVPNILKAYDPLNAVPADLEHVKNSSALAGSGTMYLDVIGGLAADLFVRDQFPLYDQSWPDRADLKLISDITALFNTTDWEWTDPYNWSAVSEDPVTGSIVPEPASMLLLGTGLIGLAGLRRRKFKKKK